MPNDNSSYNNIQHSKIIIIMSPVKSKHYHGNNIIIVNSEHTMNISSYNPKAKANFRTMSMLYNNASGSHGLPFTKKVWICSWSSTSKHLWKRIFKRQRKKSHKAFLLLRRNKQNNIPQNYAKIKRSSREKYCKKIHLKWTCRIKDMAGQSLIKIMI